MSELQKTSQGAGRAPKELSGDRTDIEREILRAVSEVKYGSVEIVIHDARVVQVERREKVRFKKDNE